VAIIRAVAKMTDEDRSAEVAPALDAYKRRAWGEAFRAFEDADAAGALEPGHLEQFATVAKLVGDEDRSASIWERAHQHYQQDDDLRGQARTAFWLAFGYMDRGEMAQAGGWLARAHRIVETIDDDCPERGYLLLPQALQLLGAGQPAEALATFEQLVKVGQRFNNGDLIAAGCLGTGQSLLRLGEAERGTASLDEGMVGVVAGEVSPVLAGMVYCGTIEACQESFDLARAQEWTEALNRWCESQPDMVPFRGRCLIYRAELMQLRGDWDSATAEIERARVRLADPPQPAIGAAFYRQAELHRVLGAHAEADRTFRSAAERGHNPQPGLALLRLAEGRVDDASATIGQALAEIRTVTERIPLLAAAVEIADVAGDATRASAAAAELTSITEAIDTSLLEGTALQASGLASISRGEHREAISALETALAIWLAMPAPYEAARTRALIARAAEALDDRDRATAERATARGVFETLGAIDDLRALSPAETAEAPAGLTPRELRVLSLVATGMTNRAIAQQLTISEKTVARHMSNIFGKLGVSSRAAATAYAYQHDLA